MEGRLLSRLFFIYLADWADFADDWGYFHECFFWEGRDFFGEAVRVSGRVIIIFFLIWVDFWLWRDCVNVSVSFGWYFF